MPLYLEDADTGRQLRLWNAQEFTADITVPETIYNPAATDTEDVILSVLRQQGSIGISGIVLGAQRIRDGATTESDPITATAEWILRLEAWLNGAPGTEAYQLRNTLTDTVTNCVPSAISWTQGVGETTSAEYSVELTFGDGLGADLGINPDTPGARDDDSFDSITLPHIYERTVDRSVELTSFEALLEADAEKNDQFIEGSPVKQVTLLGEHDGTFADQRTFDQQLRARAGDGDSYTFRSAFPGDEYEAALVGYESTREAGVTRYGEYAIELIAGQAI